MDRIDVRLLGPEKTAFHRSEPPSAFGLESEPGFEFPITLDVTARMAGTRVSVEGTVGCTVRLECSRCLEPFDTALNAEVLVEFEEGSLPEVGEDEVRAWPIKRGTKARQAAGKIHSDLERGFIRADVIPYDVFMKHGSEKAVHEAGKGKVEGKDYVVADGDIMSIRFNV